MPGVEVGCGLEARRAGGGLGVGAGGGARGEGGPVGGGGGGRHCCLLLEWCWQLELKETRTMGYTAWRG